MGASATISGKELFRVLPHPRIVAIDNKEDHLKRIQEGLFHAGLPCISIYYDEEKGLVLPNNWNPRSLRIIFLDLNLTAVETIHGNVSRAVDPIAEVLGKLKIKGPYLIVFWTSYPDEVKELMEKIAQRSQDVPLPVDFFSIDKAPFLESDKRRKTARLKNAIAAELSKNRTFLAMLAWESEVEGAALKTFDRLHGLVENRQDRGCSVAGNDLTDLLRNLAKSAWGKEHAMRNPCGAVTSGLSPLLLDSLDEITTSKDYLKIWKNAIGGSSRDWSRKLPDLSARLNSHCVVDLNSADPRSRGAWLNFKQPAIATSKLWTDCFGKSYNDLVAEFINFDKLKAGENQDEVRKKVRLGLLECTAACDYANSKAPLRRYILCALLPEELKRLLNWGDGREKKHEAIMDLARIDHESTVYLPYLNFKFALQIPPGHPILSKKKVEILFRVRSQVLVKIANHYAFHTTRPGIYEF